MLIRKYTNSKYWIAFNENNGKLLRIGVGSDDPFWNTDGPELLDVSITNYCEQMCKYCYRSSNKDGMFIELKDYIRILEEAQKIKVLQIALGGGNPNQHPEFCEILKVTRQYGIIPSYTTNGMGMSKEVYEASKKYCGAIAVSWHSDPSLVEQVVNTAYDMKIKCNIHFVLSAETASHILNLLDDASKILEKANALIFLNYKPVHSDNKLILFNYQDIDILLEKLINNKKYKIGFDSCMVSYLTKFLKNIDTDTIDFCEAGRFSAFISETLKVFPCSFMNDLNIKNYGDLRKESLQSIWKNNESFIAMRRYLKSKENIHISNQACTKCKNYSFCHGGCPIFPINYCMR